MIRIKRTGNFIIALRALVKNTPSIMDEVDKSIQEFQNNPEDTRLLNHSLRKRMEGKYAFSVTHDIRIIYKWVGKSSVRFLDIGTHQQVYRIKSS